MVEVNHSLLIVDDEEHILKAIKRLLRRDGYDIHLANGGDAAIEILKSTEVALVICDQRMPGMSGAEVLAEAYSLQPDAIRITLTGYTDLSAAQASINTGHVSHFLLKPWDDENLRDVVREGVKTYQLIQDHHRLEEITKQQKKELEAWNARLEEQVEQRTLELQRRHDQLRALGEQLEQSLRDTVRVIVGILEANNPNAGIHSKRVAKLATALAEELGLTGQELRDVDFAAHLHDIGKISKLHSRATRRPGSRQASVRKSDSGYAILSHVHGFEHIAWAVQHQDEHYDGTGTPGRLRHDDIPLISRIIAIANTYDEAVFASTYPSATSRESARKRLLDGRGKMFDPDLVASFLAVLDRLSDKVYSDNEVELSPRQLKGGMRLSRDLLNRDGALLLKRGTVLTQELIERINLMSNIDPVLGGVFVRQTTPTRCDKDQAAAKTSPQAVESNDVAMDEAKIPDQPATVDVASTPTYRPPEASESEESYERQPEVSESKRPRVLVVDDVSMLRNALKRELRIGGFDSETTDNGKDAIELVKRQHFDVMITDVMMPVMGGEELVRKLMDVAPDLPVLVITGNAKMDEVKRIAQTPNVVGILVKPWERQRLLDTLSSTLRRQPAGSSTS